MEEWRKYKLKDFIEFNPKEKVPQGELCRKISMDQITPFTRFVESNIYEVYKGGAKFRNYDTIMARITPCLENGKTAYISSLHPEEVAVGSTEYIVLRKRENISDSKFIFYLAISPIVRDIAIKSMVGSSGRQRVQQDVLENYEIPIPSLPTQKNIAHILSVLDDKIELNKRINDDLEQQAQALFKSWFVGFEPFKEGKFVDSELGRIPEGWRVERLGSVCKCLLGGTPSRNKEEYWNGKIAWINSGEINEFRITKPSEYITQEGLKKSATKLLPKKTTVLAITGATLGQVSLLEIDSCANQSVIGLLENEDIFHEYIYPLIKNRIDDLCSHMTGGAQQHINKNNVEQLEILVPPKKILVEYKQIATPIYSLISNICFESQKISKLRDSLLPRLMSGELKLDKINN